ncbi:hypothetical protein M5K25_014575 [Dendrobium thyrsiflorum]|uniref:Retrotransposon gag domain-containing protein n=1 Tax=Dendrobium thyrsiflorum TaxID=117978 RepID=A0ABD0UNJ6_DENTH
MPNPPADPLNLKMPQVLGVWGAPEGGHEVHNVIHQPTPQNIASTFEPVTAAQLEGIITEKIKAIIAVDQAEKLVGKGRPYPVEYDQVPYLKGSLTATALEWYAELPNDSVKTFAELEAMFLKRFRLRD